ncbi:YihY/virulence factor BrkB family protein [Flindersiella endophytica]
MDKRERNDDRDDEVDDSRQNVPPAKDRDTGNETVESPTDLPAGGWWAATKRTVVEFKADNLADQAAALTYYAVLSLFPALLALLSLLGLLGQSAVQTITSNLTGFVPGPARDILTTALQNLHAPGLAGLAAIGGTALAVWSASGYIAAFMRSSNTVYDAPEGRPFWKTLPIRVGLTVALLILFTLGAVVVVFTGTLAQRAGDLLGLGDTAITVWGIAKWPVLVVLVILMLALLYWAAPNIRPRGFRWVTPGSAVAVLVWLAASAAFAVYVANFSSYNKTYGTLAGIVIFLIWLWITNIAVLLGLELDAELQRSRAIRAGHPPDEEPYAPLRDTRKLRKKR